MKQHFFRLLILMIFLSSKSAFGQEKYVNLEDVKIHYQLLGSGQDTIVLLHGALQTIKDLNNQIDYFSKNYTVLAIDTRGHGRSSFADRQLSYKLFAQDLNSILDSLKIHSVHIVGWSDGGNTALKFAIQFPEKVKKIVCIGANSQPDTTVVYENAIENIKSWSDSANIKRIVKYVTKKFEGNPNPNALPTFISRMQYLLLNEPNISKSELNRIECPILFMIGDHDIIKVNHTNFMYESVKKGAMCVIPQTTHYIPQEKPSILNLIIEDFIKNDFKELQRD